jgi:hypothetical protein
MRVSSPWYKHTTSVKHFTLEHPGGPGDSHGHGGAWVRRRRHKRRRSASGRDVNGELRHRWLRWQLSACGGRGDVSLLTALRCVYHPWARQDGGRCQMATCTGVAAAGVVEQICPTMTSDSECDVWLRLLREASSSVWYTTSSTSSTPRLQPQCRQLCTTMAPTPQSCVQHASLSSSTPIEPEGRHS